MLKGIAFDLDGVIADVMAPIRSGSEDTFGVPYNTEAEDNYDLTAALGSLSPKDTANYIVGITKLWWKIPIDEIADRLTSVLYRYTGRAIPFVTHRHRDAVGAETYNLIEGFIKVPFTISFAGGTKYQGHDKGLYIPEGYDFVEDRRATAIDLASQGIKVWLIKTRYNVLDDSQKSDRIVPVDSLRDVYTHYFG
jgi:hypothetical protein